jgi:hypothetical protein
MGVDGKLPARATLEHSGEAHLDAELTELLSACLADVFDLGGVQGL